MAENEINDKIEKNEFEDFVDDDDMPPSQMDDTIAERPTLSSGDEELTPDDLIVKKFIKNPEIGQAIELEIEKIVKNPNTKGKNKGTGEEFIIGLKKVDGTVIRHDIITTDGSRYTISTWEIFYKLFGPEGVISAYGQKNKTFKGAKIKITKNYDGSHANRKASELQKLMDLESLEKAEEYKKEVAKAMKDRVLYTVEMLN